MKSLQRIFAIVMKEIRQLRRDRLTFGMIIGIPTMQLLLFGYAINFDVRHLTAGVADLSRRMLRWRVGMRGAALALAPLARHHGARAERLVVGVGVHVHEPQGLRGGRG